MNGNQEPPDAMLSETPNRRTTVAHCPGAPKKPRPCAKLRRIVRFGLFPYGSMVPKSDEPKSDEPKSKKRKRDEPKEPKKPKKPKKTKSNFFA